VKGNPFGSGRGPSLPHGRRVRIYGNRVVAGSGDRVHTGRRVLGFCLL
jgi:hypothetical protein